MLIRSSAKESRVSRVLKDSVHIANSSFQDPLHTLSEPLWSTLQHLQVASDACWVRHRHISNQLRSYESAQDVSWIARMPFWGTTQPSGTWGIWTHVDSGHLGGLTFVRLSSPRFATAHHKIGSARSKLGPVWQSRDHAWLPRSQYSRRNILQLQ